jgi:hypothetical protein
MHMSYIAVRSLSTKRSSANLTVWKSFYGDLMSPKTIKYLSIYVMWIIFLSDFSRIKICQQIFLKFLKLNFT